MMLSRSVPALARSVARRQQSALAALDGAAVDECFGPHYQGANVQSSTLSNGVVVVTTDPGPVATVAVKIGAGASDGPASAAFAASKMVRLQTSGGAESGSFAARAESARGEAYAGT